MTDQSKKPRERNNPSQATPQPHPSFHPDFKLRHDQDVPEPLHTEIQNREKEPSKTATR